MALVKDAYIRRGILKDTDGEWPYRVPIQIVNPDGTDGPQTMASAPLESLITPGGPVIITNIRGEWVITGKRHP